MWGRKTLCNYPICYSVPIWVLREASESLLESKFSVWTGNDVSRLLFFLFLFLFHNILTFLITIPSLSSFILPIQCERVVKACSSWGMMLSQQLTFATCFRLTPFWSSENFASVLHQLFLFSFLHRLGCVYLTGTFCWYSAVLLYGFALAHRLLFWDVFYIPQKQVISLFFTSLRVHCCTQS